MLVGKMVILRKVRVLEATKTPTPRGDILSRSPNRPDFQEMLIGDLGRHNIVLDVDHKSIKDTIIKIS